MRRIYNNCPEDANNLKNTCQCFALLNAALLIAVKLSKCCRVWFKHILFKHFH